MACPFSVMAEAENRTAATPRNAPFEKQNIELNMQEIDIDD